MKKEQKKQKTTKNCAKNTSSKPKLPRPTLSDLGYIDEESETPFYLRLPVPHHTKASNDEVTDHPGPEAICPCPSINDCPEADMDDNCVFINEDVNKSDHADDEPVNLDGLSQLIAKTDLDEDEDFELQAMFYVPKWDSSPSSCAQPRQGRDESLKAILANVVELLSRSPPPQIEDLEADMAVQSHPPTPPHQPFLVSFTLGVDDDDDDDDDDEVMMISPIPTRVDSNEPLMGKQDREFYQDGPRSEEQQSVDVAADSPTWDEVFSEDEAKDNHNVRDENKETDEEEIKSENESIAEEKGRHWHDLRNQEKPDSKDDGVKDNMDHHMDDSMDLFEDDEAFLQVTIPEISTPGVTPMTSPSAGGFSNSTKKPSNTLHMHTPTAESTRTLNTRDFAHAKQRTLTPQDTNAQSNTGTKHNACTETTTKEKTDSSRRTPTRQQNPDSFDTSHDFFSVNFDLGYSLEESDEDVPAPCTSTSPQPKKQAASDSSTPYNSFHRPRFPLESSESALSTPQMLSAHRRRETLQPSPLMSKGGALPSPITSPGVRRTLMPRYGEPRTPSLLSRLERRRPEGPIPQASVCLAESPPHPGLLRLQDK